MTQPTVGIITVTSDAARYDIGDAVVLATRFTDAQGVPTDPTTVTLTVRAPDATVETVTGAQLGHSAAGTYTHVLVAAQAGVHRYRWAGTGAVQEASEGSFSVRSQTV